jgi:quercetin dioxygenase-like cupin family protein
VSEGIDVTTKRLDQLQAYDGADAIKGIKFLFAGKDLGVSAWGMNVIVMEPQCTRYPEHDHASDSQEEVYVVLQGRVMLQVGDREWLLEPRSFARVGPTVRRKLVAGPQGVTILAIGSTPGKAYQPRK